MIAVNSIESHQLDRLLVPGFCIRIIEIYLVITQDVQVFNKNKSSTKLAKIMPEGHFYF